MKIRGFKLKDTEEIMKLFYDTVHHINSKDYSKKQVEAWAPEDMDKSAWKKRLSSKKTFVVEKYGIILGFANVEKNGHIDHFYCHKDHQGQRIGIELLKTIELEAKLAGVKRLFTEASITAKPFFEHNGFNTTKEQQVIVRNVKFTNYIMEKDI